MLGKSNIGIVTLAAMLWLPLAGPGAAGLAAADDCGTGGDAGSSFDAAAAIAVPVVECLATLPVDDEGDWYRFDVAAPSLVRATVQASSDDPFAAYDVRVYRPDESVGAWHGAFKKRAVAEVMATSSGAWRVHVPGGSLEGAPRVGSYSLSVELLPIPSEDDCASGADAPGQAEVPLLLPGTTTCVATIATQGDDDVYAVDVQAGQSLVVTIGGIAAAVVGIRDGPNSDVWGWGPDAEWDSAGVRTVAPVSGRYAFLVQAYGGTDPEGLGTYHLSVIVRHQPGAVQREHGRIVVGSGVVGCWLPCPPPVGDVYVAEAYFPLAVESRGGEQLHLVGAGDARMGAFFWRTDPDGTLRDVGACRQGRSDILCAVPPGAQWVEVFPELTAQIDIGFTLAYQHDPPSP